MRTKEEILKTAKNDINEGKNLSAVLDDVYESAFANGFLQGNDNAREVTAFEKRKARLAKEAEIN